MSTQMNAYPVEKYGPYSPDVFSGMGETETALPPAPLPEPNFVQQVVSRVPFGWWGILGLGILGYFGWNAARDRGLF